MFVKAIETATKFTRPFLSISRAYGLSEVMPSCATFIILNEDGWAITCKHVAEQIRIADDSYEHYNAFKTELNAIPKSDRHFKTLVKALEKKYHYEKKKRILIQQRNHFADVVDVSNRIEYIMHPVYDLALIHFVGFNKVLCNQYPVFAKNSTVMKQGMSLCRLGYPYPEFNNFRYNEVSDDIEWTNLGKTRTPLFPIDGILTRFCVDQNNRIIEIELSTPGLKGQSGGPLFDVNGTIYGIQSRTISLPLGFDQENREIIVKGVSKKVNDYSFIHLGRCIHVDVIKEFLDTHGVKYQEG